MATSTVTLSQTRIYISKRWSHNCPFVYGCDSSRPQRQMSFRKGWRCAEMKLRRKGRGEVTKTSVDATMTFNVGYLQLLAMLLWVD